MGCFPYSIQFNLMAGDVYVDAKCFSCSVGCPAVREEKGLSLDFYGCRDFFYLIFLGN